MKTVASIVSGVLMAGLIFCTGCAKKQAAEDGLAKIQKQGFFVLGLDDQFPPMGFRDDKTNEVVGFDIDLAKEVAKRIGVEVKVKPCDWDGIILSLVKGDIDVIWNGLTITPERQQKIAFSKAYLDNRQIIVVKAGSSVKGKADLAGKVVGLQLGSSSESALNSDPAVVKGLKDVKKYENNTLALMDLETGRIDAVVVDEIVGRYYIAKRQGVYQVLADDFGSEAYGIGMRQEDTTLVKAIDDALAAIKADGTGLEISKKWFGEDILK
jgi:polar amino acid transport system substrate-binding protein